MKEYATNDIFIMAAINYKYGISPDSYVYVPGSTEFNDRMTARYEDASTIDLTELEELMEFKRHYLKQKKFIFDEIRNRRNENE